MTRFYLQKSFLGHDEAKASGLGTSELETSALRRTQATKARPPVGQRAVACAVRAHSARLRTASPPPRPSRSPPARG